MTAIVLKDLCARAQTLAEFAQKNSDTSYKMVRDLERATVPSIYSFHKRIAELGEFTFLCRAAAEFNAADRSFMEYSLHRDFQESLLASLKDLDDVKNQDVSLGKFLPPLLKIQQLALERLQNLTVRPESICTLETDHMIPSEDQMNLASSSEAQFKTELNFTTFLCVGVSRQWDALLPMLQESDKINPDLSKWLFDQSIGNAPVQVIEKILQKGNLSPNALAEGLKTAIAKARPDHAQALLLDERLASLSVDQVEELVRLFYGHAYDSAAHELIQRTKAFSISTKTLSFILNICAARGAADTILLPFENLSNLEDSMIEEALCIALFRNQANAAQTIFLLRPSIKVDERKLKYCFQTAVQSNFLGTVTIALQFFPETIPREFIEQMEASARSKGYSTLSALLWQGIWRSYALPGL